MAVSVIDALRRFLPDHLRERHHAMSPAQRRAAWALTHCRTAEMGGHLHACGQCGKQEFRYHSCNHRSCPQCGRQATAEWVERQLGKVVGAPYFMVTFTLPSELRRLFFGVAAKQCYQAFFASVSSALADTLANPKWLGAADCAFTMVLHTWNQRMHFHPHIHCIVPGAGIDKAGRVVQVESPLFLVAQPALCIVFRARMRDAIRAMAAEYKLPAIDPGVWNKDWGVHIKPAGNGQNIIKYLSRYVCRTAIGDSRILSVGDTHVLFRWKDRENGDAPRVETIPGVEFVARYLRHVLPRGLRAVRYHGFHHPAAKAKLERVAFHTGKTLLFGNQPAPLPKARAAIHCPCCDKPMACVLRLAPTWKRARPPPTKSRISA